MPEPKKPKKFNYLKFEKLTPMHWELYRLIEARTLGTENKVSQAEIYAHMKAKGYDVTWNESQNQHDDHCRWLWNLVEEIKYSLEVDHIITHDQDYNYCLGDRDEVLREFGRLKKRKDIADERMSAMLTKIEQDGQFKLTSNKDEPITEESLAKLYHETFNDKGKKRASAT